MAATMDLTSNDMLDTEPTLRSAALAGKPLRLTDANRNGILLRDKIFTLRGHSSITNVLAEPVEEATFRLRVMAYGGNNYVRHDGNLFIADTDSAHAAVFHAKKTALGVELFYNNQRPAVFDRFYDLGIGPWTETSAKSQTPILIWWGSLSLTWQPQSVPPVSVSPGVVPGVGARSWQPNY